MRHPPRLATLEEIAAAVWTELARAARDKAHGWRTPVLATVDARSGEPVADARTVVLREADAVRGTLAFYSDARSAKVNHLRERPLATLVFWSRELGWQLRCRCTFSVETDGAAVAARWDAIRHSPAAQDYLSPLAPGSELSAFATPGGHGAHFAVVTGQVESIDWLELHAKGHRRASLVAGAPRWLQP